MLLFLHVDLLLSFALFTWVITNDFVRQAIGHVLSRCSIMAACKNIGIFYHTCWTIIKGKYHRFNWT